MSSKGRDDNDRKRAGNFDPMADTVPYVPQPGSSGTGQPPSDDWPEPAPFTDGPPAVPTLEPAMLPESFRPWLSDIAERMQCPLEFPSIPALVALSSVVGRKLTIRPKQRDDWAKVPNLWGAIVGPPGILKSPAAQEALKPLLRLQKEADDRHRAQQAAVPFDELVAKARWKDIESQIAGAVKKGGNVDLLRDELAKLQQQSPPARRYVVNDPTVERLAQLLEDNPSGLLMWRDELMGWLRTMERDGHESDRPFYLQAWDGNGSFTVDRVSRARVTIHGMCVAVFGGIQPGPLAKYVEAAATHGSGDDGLIQRFQLLAYPDISPEFRIIDRYPNTAAIERAHTLYRSVDMFDPASVGAEPGNDCHLPFLRFADDARELYYDFWTKLERRIRPPNSLHPALAAMLAKYRGLLPSLALLFHLVDCLGRGQGGPVSYSAAERALAWCGFLEAHARRIYYPAIDPQNTAARELAQHIKHGDLHDKFTAREVYRRGWPGLKDAAAVADGARLLIRLGWLRSTAVETGGRPSMDYEINPRLERNTATSTRQNRQKPQPRPDQSPAPTQGEPETGSSGD